MIRLAFACFLLTSISCNTFEGSETCKNSFPRPIPEPGPAAITFARPDPTLLPGDVLTISLSKRADLNVEARISQAGSITFPPIGPVEAAGKTSVELEGIVSSKLETEGYPRTSVTVMVKEFAKRQVYVLGGVVKPGGYDVVPNVPVRVLQLIAAAGGFTDRARKEGIRVIRRYGPLERNVILLSLKEIERRVSQGQADADLEVWPDDHVLVPTGECTAFVLGAVHKPGPIDLRPDDRMTVSMAIANAGSYTKFARSADVQVFRLTHSGELRKFAFDLDVIGQSPDHFMELQPSDIVFVPERHFRW